MCPPCSYGEGADTDSLVLPSTQVKQAGGRRSGGPTAIKFCLHPYTHRALCHPLVATETHLLNEPDDADGFLLTKGQGARQAVELPRELQGRKAIRGLGHGGAGSIAKALPGAAGRVQGIQGNAAQWRENPPMNSDSLQLPTTRWGIPLLFSQQAQVPGSEPRQAPS